jgi:hypothetical protein
MRYRDGMEVRAGDVVHVRHGKTDEHGIVVEVILPGTEGAANWSLPAGGVLIEGGGLGLFTVRSLEEDEDIDFVSRAVVPGPDDVDPMP